MYFNHYYLSRGWLHDSILGILGRIMHTTKKIAVANTLTNKPIDLCRGISSFRPCSRFSWTSKSWHRLLSHSTLIFSWPYPGIQIFHRLNWHEPIWFLPPPTPSRAKRTHLQNTARTKSSSTKERSIFCSCCEILEQVANFNYHVTLSASL